MSEHSSEPDGFQNNANQLNEVDPDPLSVILEIGNLVFQPGTLALIGNIASGAGAVAAAIIAYKQVTNQKKSEIRRKLFEIDRALTKGFAGLTTLASLLNEFNYIERRMLVGGAPIRGFNNAQVLRRVHEDCRSAVKEARDAFMDLSAMLPGEHAEAINRTIDQLNRLAEPILSMNKPYGIFLTAAALALTRVDELICNMGERYEFNRLPRNFHTELMESVPQLRQYRING